MRNDMKMLIGLSVLFVLVVVYVVTGSATRRFTDHKTVSVKKSSLAEMLSKSGVISESDTDQPTVEGLALIIMARRFLNIKGELPKQAQDLIAFASEQKFNLSYKELKLTVLGPRLLLSEWYSEKDQKYKMRKSFFPKPE